MDRTVTIPEGCICIPLDMYDEMSSDSDSLYFLRTALLENCELSYDKEYLRFDDRVVSIALSLIAHNRFVQKIEILRAIEEAKDAGTD